MEKFENKKENKNNEQIKEINKLFIEAINNEIKVVNKTKEELNPYKDIDSFQIEKIEGYIEGLQVSIRFLNELISKKLKN